MEEWRVKAAKQVRKLLEESIALRARADVSLSALCSGGLDSSALCVLLAKHLAQSGKDLKDFTAIHAKSTSAANDESEWAKLCVKHIQKTYGGINFEIIVPSYDDFLRDLDKVITLQDEPFGSTSIFMQFWTMQKAKEVGAKVIFSGQGADEIFLGYENYFKFVYKDLRDSGADVSDFFKEIKSFRYDKAGILDGLLGLDNFEVAFSRIKERSGIKEKYLNKNNLAELFAYKDIFSFCKNALMRDSFPSLARFEDRNSLAFGVEDRLPFMDYRIVDFVLGLPVCLKFGKGYLKYLLRLAISDILPQELTFRFNKMGFESPQNAWFLKFKPAMLDKISKSELIKEIFYNCNASEDFFTWRLYNIAKWEELVLNSQS